MPTLTQKSLKHGTTAALEAKVSQHVPYVRHLDESTIRTRDGYLLQVVEISGISFETDDQWHLDSMMNHRAQLWQGIADSRLAIYTHIIRTETHDYPKGKFNNAWAAELDSTYKERLLQKRMFKTRQFITIVRRKATGKAHILPQLTQMLIGKVDQREQKAQEAQAIEHLNDVVGQVVSNFSHYSARVLKMSESDSGELFSEAIDFLSYLVNLEEKKTRVPEMEIGEYIPASRISFARESFEVRGAENLRVGAILSVKEYPSATGTGMLDAMLRLPHEFVITQSFAFIGRNSALTAMRRQQRKIQAGGEGARALEADLDDAIDSVASGHSAFGQHHMTIMPHATSVEGLKKAINEIIAASMEIGVTPVREDINQESAFWAQLPANFGYIARAALISSQNFSGFASFHTFPTGRAHGNHWGEAVTLLATTSGAPYYFNFHDRDVGNFTCIGPTGTGKTVLLGFLVAQAQRLLPRTVFFDKDRGAEIFLRACGGEYTVVKQGEYTGLNPFLLPDTPDNRGFLIEFLKVLATVDDPTPLTPADEEQIAAAVNANYNVPEDHRTLRQLSVYFSGYQTSAETSLEKRLEKWHSGRERAWLFDNDEDTLSLGNRTLGFDLTSILDTPYARIPWLMYIFHRVDALLDGTRTLIMLDEGWKLLDDEVFSTRIKNWEKTIRKQNGLLGFATQSPSDALDAKIGKAIIEQSPTQIFLPNHKADKDEYCKGFGLTEQEYEIIRSTAPESRRFLLKHGRHSVIARLDLNGMDDFVAVLSGRTETVNLLDTIRNEVGNDPQVWLPIFNERRKEV